MSHSFDHPMRQLFVHIGTHKTGTTSFQAFLLENRERLARSGLSVMTETTREFGLRANCFMLANAVLRPTLMTQARRTGSATTPGFWQNTKQTALVRRFLADKSAQRFVVSAEALCFAREPEEAARLRRFFVADGVKIVPVVCFRKEADWRASWIDQIETWGGPSAGPGTGTDDVTGDWYFDREAILGFWAQFGRVRVLDYDAVMGEDGSVIPALLREIGVEEEFPGQDYRLNARKDGAA